MLQTSDRMAQMVSARTDTAHGAVHIAAPSCSSLHHDGVSDSTLVQCPNRNTGFVPVHVEPYVEHTSLKDRSVGSLGESLTWQQESTRAWKEKERMHYRGHRFYMEELGVSD